MRYRKGAADFHALLYGLTRTLARPVALQRVSLPVWIVGSYIVREFSKQLMGIRALQGGQHIAVSQLDKSSWQIDCDASQTLSLHYQVHAYDNSVRTAWFDTQRGFFNATCLSLKVDGQPGAKHIFGI